MYIASLKGYFVPGVLQKQSEIIAQVKFQPKKKIPFNSYIFHLLAY